MKISVIGAGGVGGYFGAKLAQAGNDVTFVARGRHLEAMLQNGLYIKSVNGDFQIDNVKAVSKVSELNKPDLVILGVKAWQVKEVARELKSVIHPETVILPLQNGVMAAGEIAEEFGKSHVLGGLCRIISLIEAPGVIKHIGINPTIVFGELKKQETERVKAIKELFDEAGIDSRISRDIEADLWKKFIGICVSGLLAITKTNYGELRELKETRAMMIALLQEIFEVAIKRGVNLKPDLVEKTVAAIDQYPAKSTSSLTRDVWEGKPSEIEYQNGSVVKLGEKVGVDTPVNKFIYRCILPMEVKARGGE